MQVAQEAVGRHAWGAHSSVGRRREFGDSESTAESSAASHAGGSDDFLQRLEKAEVGDSNQPSQPPPPPPVQQPTTPAAVVSAPAPTHTELLSTSGKPSVAAGVYKARDIEV